MSKLVDMDESLKSALRVALIYVIFASSWILFSDKTVEWLWSEPSLRATAQTYKGLVFVIVTAALLLGLVYRDSKALQRANDMDSLTGLHKISLFIRALGLKLNTIKAEELLVLSYLDIDNFKQINESLGFEGADDFLKALAFKLELTALPGSTIARLQSDQFSSFSVLDKDVDLDDYVRSFQRAFNHLARQYQLPATCSMGVAFFPSDGTSVKELMISAGEALKLAKKSKNSIQYHDKALTAKVHLRRQMLDDLEKAIADNALSLVYQPKYYIQDTCVSGIEVLLRWNHPQQGFISPAVFIPLAEEADLSSAISNFVIRQAAKELQQSGLLDGGEIAHVSINISATEFNNPQQMVALTHTILDEPLLARYMRIEITETATLNDMKKSLAIISNLQSSGITFSVDDFGTGYTSLAMLKDLTVDEIKIDRSFVSGIETDERCYTIVKAIVAMAKSFEINVVAEGVETQGQLDALANLGCNEVQGYLLGRPMAITELIKHLHNLSIDMNSKFI